MPSLSNTETVPNPPKDRPWRLRTVLALQALLWVVLALVFAGLIEMSGWSTRTEALTFSASHWLPWVVLAPAVFWLARRFPVERGRLRRSVPVHLLACLLCSGVMMWIGAQFAPVPGPRGGGPGGRSPMSRDRFEPMPPPDGTMPERMRKEWRDRPMPEGFRPDRDRGVRPAPVDAGPEAPGEAIPSERRIGKGGPRPGGDGPRAMPMPMPGGGGSWMMRFWPPFSGIILRANVNATIYAIIACLAHAFAYYRRAQDREREALALAAGLSRAKLDALRLQLQPHFLFNTLNAISTLVHRDANAADELIGDLSELLRLSLQTSEHEVPLVRELELLDCYLAIEQTRLGGRLKIVREIDPAALGVLVPTFVLQPLAENAVRHGIEPRRAPGTLTIRADRVGDTLRLTVADDGVGLKAAATGASRRGIGISNTEQRLRALHGDAGLLDIVAPESGGVQVQIVLPARTKREPEPATAGGAA